MAKKTPTPRSAMRYQSRATRIALRDPELAGPKVGVELSESVDDFAKTLRDSAFSADMAVKAFEAAGRAMADGFLNGFYGIDFASITGPSETTKAEVHYILVDNAATSDPPRRRNRFELIEF